MFKIGLVFDDSLDKPDGVQQYVLTVGTWLAAQGHDVHYLTGQTTRTDIPKLHSMSRNVRVRFNQNRMAMPLPAKRGAIRDLLRQEQFDVLHVQVPYSPFLAGRIIKAAPKNTAIVGTFHVAPHSALVTFANRLLRLFVARSFRRFDTLIGAPAAAAFAKRTFGTESVIMPLPLKLDPFFQAQPFEQYAAGKTVVFLGRLVERKGCQYLLQAVSKAVADGQWPVDARVVICGGGPLEADLRAYVARQKITDIVSFTGYVTEADKPRCLASADVVVYPSTGGESFGVVLLEAMAAAKGPVFAGDNPGYVSVMGERPQQLFDPKDTVRLADKIITALRDETFRERARAWQQAYVRRFDIAAIGPKIVAIYEQALQRHPR